YVYNISRPRPGVAIATIPHWAWSVAVSGTSVFVGTGDGTGLDRGAIYVFSPTEPELAIAAPSQNSATISWTPVDWPEFLLQFNDTLAPDSWVNAPSGATNPVNVSSTNRARFYRLWSP